jgi:hypothetical protein
VGSVGSVGSEEQKREGGAVRPYANGVNGHNNTDTDTATDTHSAAAAAFDSSLFTYDVLQGCKYTEAVCMEVGMHTHIYIHTHTYTYTYIYLRGETYISMYIIPCLSSPDSSSILSRLPFPLPPTPQTPNPNLNPSPHNQHPTPQSNPPPPSLPRRCACTPLCPKRPRTW